MTIRVRFEENTGSVPSKLADAALHFEGGELDDMKLVGFAVWERRDHRLTVTFPARQYAVNGERRSFALLRPDTRTESQDRVRDLILAAWEAYEAARPAKTAAVLEALQANLSR